MKRTVVLVVLVVLGCAAAAPSGADAGLQVGLGVRKITPHASNADGASWGFAPSPNGIWGEQFTDQNGNGFYDVGEPFVDDVRNTQIDPQSAGKWDGCWTNAGFGGRGARGILDDTWARAVVMRAGGETVAMVSLDVVGFFYEEIERIRAELDAEAPGHGVDMVIVSSTHTHEGCDTMGYWGSPPIASDGKSPMYNAFIRSQAVDAIKEGLASLEDARMKVASTYHLPPTDIRDSRPPRVFDPWLRTAQFVRGDDSVIGTIVRWSNHPEALWSGNPFVSSDFPHGARARLEEEYGAPAVYFSGSVGGLMTTGRQPDRYVEIGENVGEAAIAALAGAEPQAVNEIAISSKEVFMTSDNVALRTLNVAGIFDKPTYLDGIYAERLGDQFKTQIVSVKVGPARFQTVPGELFPEIEVGGYGRDDGCTWGTGRPYEPVIQDQFEEEHVFVLGLAQDELGYIVPGYDFFADGPRLTPQTPRPIVGGFGGLAGDEDPCGEGHYEETVSASSVMAPIVACTIAELAGRDPWSADAGYKACTEENTTTAPQGLHPNG